MKRFELIVILVVVAVVGIAFSGLGQQRGVTIINTKTGEKVNAKSMGHHQLKLSIESFEKKLAEADLSEEDIKLRKALFGKYSGEVLEDDIISMQEMMIVSVLPKKIMDMTNSEIEAELFAEILDEQ
jgi:hypothetical protein